MSFKNLTLKEEKISHNNVLILLEWRLGHEEGVRMDYVESVYKRYRKAPKPSKTEILDELCEVCKCNRNYAISKISQLPNKDKPRSGPKRKRSKKYDHQVLEVEEKLNNISLN